MFNNEKLYQEFTASVDKVFQQSEGVSIAVQEKIKEALSVLIKQLDLVSREEFDAQTKVLARTREKLENLERRLDDLTIEKTSGGAIGPEK